MIADLLMLFGAVLLLVAGIGVVRFPDVLTRMHALTKASTLALVLVLVGAAVSMSHRNDVTSLILAALLQFLTLPVSSNLLSRAVHLAGEDH